MVTIEAAIQIGKHVTSEIFFSHNPSSDRQGSKIYLVGLARRTATSAGGRGCNQNLPAKHKRYIRDQVVLFI